MSGTVKFPLIYRTGLFHTVGVPYFMVSPTEGLDLEGNKVDLSVLEFTEAKAAQVVAEGDWVEFDPNSVEAWAPLLGGSVKGGGITVRTLATDYPLDPDKHFGPSNGALAEAATRRVHEEGRSLLQRLKNELADPNADVPPEKRLLGQMLVEIGDELMADGDELLGPAVNVNEGAPRTEPASAPTPGLPAIDALPVIAFRGAGGVMLGENQDFYLAVYEHGEVVMHLTNGYRSNMYTTATKVKDLAPFDALHKFMSMASTGVILGAYEIFDPATGEARDPRTAQTMIEENDDGTISVFHAPSAAAAPKTEYFISNDGLFGDGDKGPYFGSLDGETFVCNYLDGTTVNLDPMGDGWSQWVADHKATGVFVPFDPDNASDWDKVILTNYRVQTQLGVQDMPDPKKARDDFLVLPFLVASTKLDLGDKVSPENRAALDAAMDRLKKKLADVTA